MSATVTGRQDRLTGAQWHMLVLASLGGALEFFDFVMFGVFATSIGAAFFPASDPVVSQIAGYATFGVGYLARPLGGLIMAHLGDRRGRRGVFVGSILVVSLATIAIGLLPGYATLGVAAPLLLLTLRLIQGFCIGGEFPGAITYIVEMVPHRAGTGCGVAYGFVNSGVLLAGLISLLIHRGLSPEAAADWGWRIGFLVGGLAGLVGYPLRRALDETPAFTAMRHAVLRVPLREVLRSCFWQVVVAAGIATTTAGFNAMLFVYLQGYLTRVVRHDAAAVSLAVTVGLATYTVALPAVAWIGDRAPRRLFLGAASILLLLGSWTWFGMVANDASSLIPMLALAGCVGAMSSGVFPVMMADLFPARMRYSGIALPYNFSFAVFSGTAPLIATYAITATGSVQAPALVVSFCAALGLLATLFAGRYAGRLHT